FILDPSTGQMWVSNDGGVYQRNSGTGPNPWLMRNQGLHTHHIHTLSLMTTLPEPVAPGLAYPTSDNDAWFSNMISSPTSWHSTGLGDVNWSASDAGNRHQAVVARQRTDADLVQDSAPWLTPITVSNDTSFEGPEAFHFIETLPNEGTPDTKLDAVMLTTLPL